MNASINGHIQIVKYLIENAADMNIQDIVRFILYRILSLTSLFTNSIVS
jgi:hypothetical protein